MALGLQGESHMYYHSVNKITIVSVYKGSRQSLIVGGYLITIILLVIIFFL